MAKGSMLSLPGRPKLLMEGRGRRGARTALDSDWFDLDRDGLIARLMEFGLAESRATIEADDFLEYRRKLRETEALPEKTTPDETSPIFTEWEKAQQKRRAKEDGE